MDKKLEKIFDLKLDASDRDTERHGLIQYDYGQILRIHGLDLPPAVEIQFSYREKGGTTENRVGTTKDGVTEVQIPDKMLKNNGTTQDYAIWVFIYVTDETSGNTVYRIKLYVDSRPAPGKITEDLDEPHPFDEAVNAVNAAADRAEQAEQNAKARAIEAGKYAASASESATAAEKSKEDALREVGEKKQEAIKAIQEQEETSVGKITTHTDDEIQRILNQTAEPKRELEQTITNADASKRELDHSIETAGTSKTALDKSVELAGTAKTELDKSTQKAGEAKTALDGSAKTAGEMQKTLSATVKQAGTLDTSLGEKIETGTQLKTDLTVSGEKAVQDIQTAGSEQLGKMQAVAEEFTADREQIATNKEDIGSLKEELSNKITKFYASNQGETHVTDSDKGLIQDLKIYGQSKQDGEPSPSNPVEIKNVVNPKMSVCGSNILQKNAKNIILNTFKGNITLNDDGSLSYEGSILTDYAAIYIGKFSLKKGTYQLLANQYSSPNDIGAKLIIEKASGTDYILNNKPFIIDADDTKCRIFISSENGANYPLPVKGTVRCALVYSGSTTDIQPYIEQSVILPITLNAIPVSSGGNVTIDGQQYIADRVVEKDGIFGIERNIREIHTNTKTMNNNSEEYPGWNKVEGISDAIYYNEQPVGTFRKLTNISNFTQNILCQNNIGHNNIVFLISSITGYSQSELIAKAIDVDMYIRLQDAIFEPLPGDIQAKLRTLVTNYPVTNVSITSDQLDGYTVFNYPISMANGWNYVKQQLGDTRDYIYDMDAKAQDIDIQSAEAYVNSEYAVALTELEV